MRLRIFHRLRFSGALLALPLAVALAGCAQYARVAVERPKLIPRPPGTGALVAIEQKLSTALRHGGDSQARLGAFLDALHGAGEELRRDPKNAVARRDYNFTLQRVFEVLRESQLDPWNQPLAVNSAGGAYVLTHQRDPRPEWNPALYDFMPADELKIGGTYMTHRHTKDGLGAPLVARRREVRTNARATFTPDRPCYGVTALARFEGRRCIISFADPLAAEDATLDGHRYPLAADHSAPLAVMLADSNARSLELSRLLNPGKFAESARISRLQPYDPNKTVVLVIHGLMDSPATWAPMLNDLLADPEIRKHYQLWFFSYPSGYPYPYSAAILRKELDAIEKRYALQKKMVLVGHSMGGCISRLMITDTGDKVWLGTFGKPPGQVRLSPRNETMLREALIFRHRPEVGRVIFISAPLRGSNLASNFVGRIGSSLVRAPRTLLNVAHEAGALVQDDESILRLRRIPNSVDTLAPNNRFVKLIGTIPLTPGIPYHSIMGDRGRGDTPDSSDGIVPYWSSHLDGASSELIVPSSHSAHQNPAAIEEVRRILKQAARQ